MSPCIGTAHIDPQPPDQSASRPLTARPLRAAAITDLPDDAYIAALAGLPHLTPSRLRCILEGSDPSRAWERIRAGRAPAGLGGAGPDPAPEGSAGGSKPRWTSEALSAAWCSHARRTDPRQVWADYRSAGVRVCRQGRAGYPPRLAEDPEAPPILFWSGDLQALGHPSVGLVGTRSCTHYGEEVAAELGLGLAQAGVSVVSGLALGIDGAAHRGALAARGFPPIGIVASGLDTVYPPRHARLWQQVALSGALISEAPLGAVPEAWRFPWRNRLIAALSDVVVVVESHRSGGALLTVQAAIRRGVPVLAVPGSIRSPASAGTNALIADGCSPVRDVDDVLVALSLSGGLIRHQPVPAPRSSAPTGGAEAAVWAAIGAEPTPTETIMRRTGLSLAGVALALDHLEEEGWVRGSQGFWGQAVTVPVC